MHLKKFAIVGNLAKCRVKTALTGIGSKKKTGKIEKEMDRGWTDHYNPGFYNRFSVECYPYITT